METLSGVDLPRASDRKGHAAIASALPGDDEGVDGIEVALMTPLTDKPIERDLERGASARLNLLIIEPKLLTRGCLVAAISGALAEATSVSTIEEALYLVSSGMRFDAILINLSSGALDGRILSELSDPLRAMFHYVPIIVLTTSVKSGHVVAALRQGARGYVTTDMRVDMMIDAIRLVVAGWAVHPSIEVDPHPSERRAATTGVALASKLTPRQAEVLRYLATGMPNKSIAARLSLSERTVKAHVQEIMQRVGASNRTQIVALLGNGPGMDAADEPWPVDS